MSPPGDASRPYLCLYQRRFTGKAATRTASLYYSHEGVTTGTRRTALSLVQELLLLLTYC